MEPLILKLYVSGRAAAAEQTARRLRAYCAGGGYERVEVEVVDVRERPDAAEENRILATPTLVKESPSPARKVIGDFSDLGRVAQFLGICCEESSISNEEVS